MTTTTSNKLTTCQYCNKKYLVRFSYETKRRKYCSAKCYHLSLHNIVGYQHHSWKGGSIEKIICLQCKQEFIAKLSNTRKRKFCGINCKGIYYSGKNNPKYSGGKHKKICVSCGKTFWRNNSEIQTASFCSKKCYHDSMPNLYVGEKSSNWQGGKEDRKNVIRKSIYYRNWQKKVYKRDGGKCRMCGSKKLLQTHHIIPLRDNINLTFKVGNGILLCHDCHSKTFHKENQFVCIFSKILRDYTLNIRKNDDIVRTA